MPSTIEIAFTLNDSPVTLTCDPARSVLSLLREELGVRSLTAGCSPQGICGCCAAMVNGKPRLTCTLRAKTLGGKVVSTHASLPPAEREAFSAAFVASGGAQCGYCTPGIVTAAAALLQKNPAPTDADIDKAMSMHVCRCTGWSGVRRSIAQAGRILAGEDAPALPAGSPEPARAVLGERPRIDDMTRPGMLHAALVFAPRARCRVESIDTDVPGVVAVLTADDVPGQRTLGAPIADWPVLVAAGEQTRCAADVVAVVVAESAAGAAAGAAAVTVHATAAEPVPVAQGEVIAEERVQRGEAEAGGAVTATATFTTAQVDPAYLEPDAALAVPTTTGFVVYGSGQDPFGDQRQLAALLGGAAVEVRSVPCGGAFGGRSEVGVQAHALLAAAKLGRPVRLVLPHRDAIRLHPKRQATTLTMSLHATAAGELTALTAELVADTGGYASQGPEMVRRALEHITGPYAIPSVQVVGRCVRTSAPVGGAMRGLGCVPVAFALERLVDDLAGQLGVDPLQLREQNLADRADFAPIIDAIRPRYQQALDAQTPHGIALAVQGLGRGVPQQGRAILEVRSTGEVAILTGFLEAGQNIEGRFIRLAAAASGLPTRVFTVQTTTAVPVDSGPSLAGVDFWLGGQAVAQAAAALSDALDAADGALAALAGQRFSGHAQAETGYPEWGRSAQLALLDEKGALQELVAAVGVGERGDAVGLTGQIEGAVHMGIGAALSEEVIAKDAMPDTQYRMLGVLKAKHSPAITAIAVPVPGTPPVDDVAILPTAPAIAAAIEKVSGVRHAALPMKSSHAARAVGVRPPRKPRR